jgi:hypothetical protein
MLLSRKSSIGTGTGTGELSPRFPSSLLCYNRLPDDANRQGCLFPFLLLAPSCLLQTLTEFPRACHFDSQSRALIQSRLPTSRLHACGADLPLTSTTRSRSHILLCAHCGQLHIGSMKPVRKRARIQEERPSVLLSDYRTAWTVRYVSPSSSSSSPSEIRLLQLFHPDMSMDKHSFSKYESI